MKAAPQITIRYKHFHTDGLDVQVYDQRFKQGPDPLLENDVSFYADYACRYAGAEGRPVLELGSGTGRISWELVRLGCEVIGLDISSEMNRIAENKGAGLPADWRRRASFTQGDMTAFNLGRTFPLVIIPCRSFQCLETVEQQIACLRTIHDHLEPGGRLIINLFDPRFDPYTSSDWKKDFGRIPTVTHPETGNTVHIDFVSRKNDFFHQTIEEVWTYTEVDDLGAVLRQEESTLKMRWTTRTEMRHLFALAGYTVEGEFSDFYKSAPVYGREQVWVVRK